MLESLSKLISILAAVLASLILPVIVELIKFIVKAELASTTKSPSISWLIKVKVITPPFEPDFPHSEVPSAFKNVLEPYLKVHSSKLISAWVLVTKNMGAEEYTLLEDSISIVDLSQLNLPVPVLASPDIDWYIIIPHWSTFFLLGFPLHFKLEDSLTVTTFFPSITTAWAPVADPSVLLTVISPVE